jgi:small subunit ribosomal protein S6
LHPLKKREEQLNNLKMNKNQYESVVILTPVLSEKQMTDAITSYRQLITENGGEVTHEENWGLTKLAYPIQKKVTGFYHIYEFSAPGDIVEKMETRFARDEQVMRHITIKLDKHAALYNERKKKGEFNKVQASPEAEPEVKPVSK